MKRKYQVRSVVSKNGLYIYNRGGEETTTIYDDVEVQKEWNGGCMERI